MEWQFTSDRPIYIQLSDQIVSGILTGKYKMGEKLPSVREFAEIAAVNPNTVQRALSELEAVGLIDNQRTTGKFVTQDEARIAMAKTNKGEVLTIDFLKNMAGLGYSKKQSAEIVTDVASKEEENG